MFIVVLLVLLLVLGSSNFYLAHRLWRWIHEFCPNLTLTWPLIFCVVMTVMMLLSVIKPFSGVLQRVISCLGVCWMGLFVYLLLSFLLADVVTLVPRLLKLLSDSAMAKFRLIAGISATALALSVCIYGFCHAQRICTKDYNISLSDASGDQMKIVFISDVHLGALGSEARLEKIVDKINAASPDLVCIGGDFFDSNFASISDPERALEIMHRIESRYGVYACLGNHDAGKTFPAMEDFLARANVTLLKEEYVVIDGRLILAGRLDGTPIGGAGENQRGELETVLQGADPSLPVVMLDHNPASVDSYRDEVDLLLSGHTHRGQIFPGSLITGAMYTVDYGYYRADSGLQAIVSSGAGIWGLPMRVGTDCEFVVIRLEF